MLKYQGHSFFGDGAACACCSIVDKVALDDPTGTKKLRAKFRAELQLRWNKVRIMARQIIVDNDLLQLNAAGLLPVKTPASPVLFGGTKVNAFQRWIDQALLAAVYNGDPSGLREQISTAYFDGVEFAQKQIGRKVMAGDYAHRIDTIAQLMGVELQGIMEAVSQQAVRAVANGLLSHLKASVIARQVIEAIDRIATSRTQALVNVTIITAFNNGSLDTYAAAKIDRVGIVAEAAAPRDAKGRSQVKDAPRRRGPGSRSFKTPGGPSARTIRRIKSVEARLSALGRVEVQTAGDENVCQQCEDIADAGPYTIDHARSLIPAHPNCRCAFVPVEE